MVAALSFRHRRRHAETLGREIAARTHERDETRALLEVVVDNTPASLLVLDRDLRVVRANRTAERVHGGSLVGVRCFESIAERSDRCTSCPAITTFETGEKVEVPGLHTDPKTGEVLAVESHPLTLPDGRQLVLLVERVMTEQKKLQARLLHQEKMAAFGLLAAGVAHDLGNPLSSIEVQLQLLDVGELTKESAAIVSTVRQETARLRRLLRELVDFARRRRDEATLVSTQSVVGDALRLVRHDQRMRRIRVEEEFDAEAPPVFFVEDHLMQVVLNLLLNSLDSMPDGGKLRIDVRSVGDRVALRIHDTGAGMEPAVLAHCFEPLFTTKAVGKGTGLGLSICRDILKEAGGTIELHSSVGRGTTAVVTMPAVCGVGNEVRADSGKTAAGCVPARGAAAGAPG